MVKKNTLLYLDVNLVKNAKKRNLNISKITESGIKYHLFPYLSYGEKAALNFRNYLDILIEEKRCFPLPFCLKKVDINNLGNIEDLSINFEKINILLGNYGSGKTTIIRCIAHLFGLTKLEYEHLLRSDSLNGKINVEITSNNKLVMKLKRDNYGTVNRDNITKCYLLDDPGERLDDENFNKFLSYLRQLNLQIIMAVSPRHNISFNRIDKIFDLRVKK
jgi:ABC-type lipoprotein export system ATPase subunit